MKLIKKLFTRTKTILVLTGIIVLFQAPELFAQGTYTTNGSAFSNGGNTFTLTNAVNSQVGSVWNTSLINLNSNFDFTFSLYLGYNPAGADGIAFVMQPIGTTIGGSGNSLGYGGITPSVDIEFDTYVNQDTRNDPLYDHISIQKNGDASHFAGGGTLAGPVSATPSNGNIKDGQWHTARIIWNASTKTIIVYFDGIQRITYSNDFTANFFSGNPNVYWGFTGATGGLSNLQEFSVTSLNFPSPLSATVNSSNVTCYGANNGGATVTPAGGSAPYTITWSNGQSGSSSYGLAPGTYTVTVTDYSGAIVTKSVTILQPQQAQVEVTASGPTSFCAGNNVILTTSSSAAKSSLSFNNGLVNYVEVPGSSANSSLSALTLEAWIKVNNINGGTYGAQYIISKGTDDMAAGQYGLVLVHNGNGTPIIQFHFSQGGNHQGVDGFTAIAPGQWYHIAGSWDGATARLYINGVLDNQTSFTGPLPANSDNIQIGRLGKPCCPYPFEGEIDEVRIWNVGRTQAEVQNYKNVNVYIGTPGLIGYYKFDEGYGTLTADDGKGIINSAAVNATLVNSPAWVSSGAPVNYSYYQWSPGGMNTQSINVTNSGSYRVTATDANSCSAVSSAVAVNVTANVVNCPSNISVNIDPSGCGAVVSYASPLVSACPGVTITQTSGLPSGSVFPIGSTTNSFQIKDQYGNIISTCSFIVTVIDNIKPVITCPADITVNAATGQCGATVTWGAASVPDQQQNAMGSATQGSNQWQSFTAGLSGKLTEIQLFTNGYSSGTQPYNFAVYAGQGTGGTLLYSGSGSFNTPFANWFSLIIPSASAPAIVAGNIYTFQIQVTGSYNQLASNNGNAYLGGVYFSDVYGQQNSWDLVFHTLVSTSFATDNCGTPVVTSDHNPGDFFPVGTTTVTQTATDASGNTATCSFKVTVTDNQNPAITCPANITVNTDPGACSATISSLGTPATQDNCGVQSVTNNHPSNVYPIGTTIVTWTVTDVHGRTTACTQSVTVNVSAPVVNCPSNISVSSDAMILLASYPLASNLSDATGHFNDMSLGGLGQGGLSVNNGVCINGHYANSVDPLGQEVRTSNITSLNPANFSVSTDFKINALPATASGAPVILAGGSYRWLGIHLAADGKVGVHYNNNQIILSSTTLVPGQWYSGQLKYSGGAVQLIIDGNTVLTQNIGTLDHGNNFNFSTSDGAFSTAFNGCIKNLQIFNGTSGCGAVVSYQSPLGNTCSGATVTQLTGLASGSVFPVGVTTNSFEIKNISGAVIATCSFTVTVTDNIGPVIVSPSNITVNNDPGTSGAVVNLPALSASDNCGIASIVNDHTSSFYPIGNTVVHWTVTDNHGNISSASQTVSVKDNEKPLINCLAPIVVTGAGPSGVIVNYPLPFANDNYSTKVDTISAGCSDGVISFPLTSSTNVKSINFVTSGAFSDIAHGHGINVNIKTELYNSSLNAWIPVQSIQTGAGDFHFGGSSVSFAPITRVSQIRLTADQIIGCAFHLYKLAVKINSSSVTQIAGLPGGSQFPVGVTTNTFVATDSSGNKDTCSFTVTVIAGSDPGARIKTTTTTNVTPPPAKAATGQSADKISIANNKEIITNGDGLKVKVFPVPTKTSFNFIVTSPKSSAVNIRILDNAGRLVEVMMNVSLGSAVTGGGKLPSGTYYAEVTQGDEKKLIKIIKLR